MSSPTTGRDGALGSTFFGWPHGPQAVHSVDAVRPIRVLFLNQSLSRLSTCLSNLAILLPAIARHRTFGGELPSLFELRLDDTILLAQAISRH